MTLVVPNKAVTYPFQSRVFESDWLILGRAVGGQYGVIADGCALTASVVPAMTAELASGQVVIAGVRYDVAGQTVTFPDADPLLPRFDMVVVADDGLAGVVLGTADAAPFAPNPPVDTTAIAAVFLPAADTAISNEQMTDKRVNVSDPQAAVGWNRVSASTDLARSQQGTRTFDSALTFAASANVNYRVRGMVAWTMAVGSSHTLSRGINGPASPSFFQGQVGIAVSNLSSGQIISLTATNYTTFYQQTSAPFSGAAFAVVDTFDFVIQNGSTAGTLGMSWGQSVASALVTTRKAGSYIEYEVV